MTGGIPIDKWSGAEATNELHGTIREFVDASEKQTAKMIQLTEWIKWLTVALGIIGVAQIVLIVRQG